MVLFLGYRYFMTSSTNLPSLILVFPYQLHQLVNPINRHVPYQPASLFNYTSLLKEVSFNDHPFPRLHVPRGTNIFLSCFPLGILLVI